MDSEENQIQYIDHNVLLDIPLDAIYDAIQPLKAVSIRKAIFYLSDLQTLLPGQWLNDKIINFYFELLAEHHQTTYYFSTFAYQMITTKSLQELELAFASVNFEAYDTFFIPIHTYSHWSLVRIQDNLLTGFDSLGEVPSCVLKRVMAFYADIVTRTQETNFFYRRTNGKIPRQTNGDDCGVFCCAYAKHYVSGGYESFSADDIPRIRREILHEILAGRIMYG